MDKSAYIRLTEHNSPHIKGMELGKRYHLSVEVEPVELSTGENEYSDMPMGANGEKAPKPPMHGRFKVHSIDMASSAAKPRKGGKSAAKEAKEEASEGKKATKGRYA
ncbi:MAG: hypothetical protein KGI03_00905 [Patescibacteria group bacterium]|nr:hypothetical protein [Patescibacteria group bacterium]